MHNLCLDIPIEGTFDANRAKVFGNKPKQLLIYRAKYGEDALNKVIKFAKAGIPLIGIDSVPSMIPKEDAEKVLKSSDKDSIEEQRIGGTARLLNKYLPIIEEIIEITGTTLIFTNQVRDKMNAMMFGEKTDTPGGRKLKHSCSIRIQVARRAWIEIPNKNPFNSASNEKVGMIMKCKVVKSKVSNPMGECEIPLFFDRGFVSFDQVKEIRREIMKSRAEQFGKRMPKGGEWDD
jgi:recombination protein RecA